MLKVIYDPTNKHTVLAPDGAADEIAHAIVEVYGKEVRVGNFMIIDCMRLMMKNRELAWSEVEFFYYHTEDGSLHPINFNANGGMVDWPSLMPEYTTDILSRL